MLGFPPAEKTWLPVHPNYDAVNVEKESQDDSSLLNTIRAILKIRKEQAALREGIWIWLEDLPGGVLGFKRQKDKKEITVVLNFTDHDSEFTLAGEGLQSFFNYQKKTTLAPVN